MEKSVDKIIQAINSRFCNLKDVLYTEIANFSNWPVALDGNAHKLLVVLKYY
jgi:hypothetical protein